MHKRSFVLILLLLMQAWGPLLAQTPPKTAEGTESPGMLQNLAENAREAKRKIESVGGVLMDFAGAYYEDNIQPVTGGYFEWASNARRSFWEKLWTTVDNYNRYKTTNTTV
ncbi:apolipoprotein C-IV [Genypterus blacodes]|uniref:apolipoprotein C-IV n=1 Tax=Genypterus blacodes TaxID=154954 RepID=UPI003F772100